MSQNQKDQKEVETRRTQVETQLCDLDQMYTMLEEAVDDLEARLTSVVTKEQVPDVDKGEGVNLVPQLVPLATVLRERVEWLRDQVSRLASLRRRIEL